MNKLDLTNEIYGKLTVIKEVPSKNKRRRKWLCKCSCGNTKEIAQNELRTGDTQSCGCLKIKHGDAKNKTRLWKLWTGMRNRCSNPNIKKAHLYSEKGITYSPEWEEYLPFKNWALNDGYSDELSLDRIDGNKGYFPDNCRWVSLAVQSRNRTTAKGSSKYFGVSYDKSRKKWAACISIDNKTKHLGRFLTELEAAKARDVFIKESNLEGFNLNLP